MVNFKRFEVPHDDFFNKFKFYDVKTKGDISFQWYGDYDPNKYFLNGNYRSEIKSYNTKLLLEGNYEKN